ncbi:MAG: 3-isopropylmalate dehydrogenase [Myxococcales bacterium]
MKASIALLPGDGIGPEVLGEAVQVLRAVADRFGHAFELREALFGGCAIDAAGTPLPPDTLALCRSADAVLFGAVGGPKWDPPAQVRPEQGLLALRKELGLFANLRPVVPDPRLAHASTLRPEVLRGVDLLIVRELTSGIYFGRKHREPGYAIDTCTYTVAEVERVVRAAGRLSQGRRKTLCSVDKANVLETSRLWREVATRVVRDEFPDVTLSHLYVDNCAMQLIREPSRFDVIVTENMFGDILSDEASMIAGSIGMLPSASLGEGTRGLYEPIHGSAPDIAGRGVANPYGTILSAAMLLRLSLNLPAEAAAVEAAVAAALGRGVFTGDLAPKGARGAGTAEAGRAVLEHLYESAPQRGQR